VMGSRYRFLVRLVEWHTFWESFEDLQHSALAARPSCQVCYLLWQSTSDRRRKEIIWGRRWLWIHFTRKCRRRPISTADMDGARHLSRPKPFNLRVKIWEERPLTLYTFAQLFRDETAMGARLLIHRGSVVNQPEGESGCRGPPAMHG
jgi:hypothetical protein